MRNGPYTLLVAPKDYPGKKYRGRYVYEHYLVYWRIYKAIPLYGFELHHINGNHRDNRIENLKLVTSSEHRKIHGQLLKEKYRIKTECFVCRKHLLIAGNDFRFRMKKSKSKKSFCSRKCGAINQHSELAGGS